MRKVVIYGFILMWQIVTLSVAYAWKLPVEVTVAADNDENVYNKLVIGLEAGATDGYDNLWDTPALISHPDPDRPLLLRAFIKGNGNGMEETRYLWKDIRGPAAKGSVAWDIAVDSVPVGQSVAVSWDFKDGMLKSGEHLVLRDNGKTDAYGKPTEVDITEESNYTFVSGGQESRSLSLVYSKEAVQSSGSGSGSGFGCGTIKPHGGNSADSSTVFVTISILLLPWVFVKLRRWLTLFQFSI